MSRLARFEQLAMWSGLAVAVAGFLASFGRGPLPGLERSWLTGLHLPVALLGVAAGVAAARRLAEIEAARWRALAEPQISSGEREWAHKEAERAGRAALLSFLSPPLALGYCLSNLFPHGSRAVAGLLSVTGVAAYFLAWWMARRRRSPS